MQTVYDKVSREVITTYNLGQRKQRNGEKIGELVLTISTRKDSHQGISTYASVSLHLENFTEHAFSFGGDGDYSKNMLNQPCKRVTEKALLNAHENVRGMFNDILQAALAHYGITQEQYLKRA
jgi:hypothetical protein